MRGPTALRPEARPGPRSLLPGVAIAALLVVLAGLTLPPLSRLLEAPAVVDPIRFDNPTSDDLAVEATDADRSGWTPVGTARRGEQTRVEGAIDQGRVWIFRFSAQGEGGGELRVDRWQLEREGWLVRIPDGIGDQLAARGAPVAP